MEAKGKYLISLTDNHSSELIVVIADSSKISFIHNGLKYLTKDLLDSIILVKEFYFLEKSKALIILTSNREMQYLLYQWLVVFIKSNNFYASVDILSRLPKGMFDIDDMNSANLKVSPIRESKALSHFSTRKSTQGSDQNNNKKTEVKNTTAPKVLSYSNKELLNIFSKMKTSFDEKNPFIKHKHNFIEEIMMTNCNKELQLTKMENHLANRFRVLSCNNNSDNSLLKVKSNITS